MANKVRLNNFVNCCGTYILNNFFDNMPRKLGEPGYTLLDGYKDQDHVDRLINIPNGYTETPEAWKKRIKDFLVSSINVYKNTKSYFLAVLNKSEKEHLHDIFIDVGFEVLVPETKNPTGTTITMYIYHLLPRQPVETKSILERTT